MKIGSVETDVAVGTQIHQLISELFPICRSITGHGVRDTLGIVKTHIPIEIHEVPTGTKVFDWEVPVEWNISDAWIKNSKGEKIVDFKDSNLHVMNYSIPVHQRVTLDELRKHLHYSIEHPDWIPYRTSYYNRQWAFCMSYHQYQSLQEDTYEVMIDSSLEAGNLTYGELYLPGNTTDEVLISTHVCHPSLCNDNLSGIGVVAFLAKHLMKQNRRYSYRLLFIPTTIGSITWLALNKDNVSRIKHGLVATLLGDTGVFHYKKSRRKDAEIDAIVEYVLKQNSPANKILDFFPFGYDERQYCSPGFNLPVGRLTRTPYGEYPEYHTSADNLEFVRPECLEESLNVYIQVVETLEANKTYLNLSPYGEPQLGKRGLYSQVGGDYQGKDFQFAILWVLALSDGNNSLLDITRESKMDFAMMRLASDKLVESGLLNEKTTDR